MGGTKMTRGKVCCMVVCVCLMAALIRIIVYGATRPPYRPSVELASMDFTLLNITQTRLSANWDLLIRVPENLPDNYICLQGDLQASILYKDIILVTSSRQRYENLKPRSAQQLRVSAGISEEDIGGLIGENMIKDIKEKNEVKFGSRLFLTDCREETTGTMRFVCDETTLRFEPGSEMNATAVGNNPTCRPGPWGKPRKQLLPAP